jgi:subtilisin family serine protease
MRLFIRVAFGAALALGTLAAAPVAGVAAVPGPLPQQWWFSTWDIQDKVWPITQGEGVTVAVIDSGVQASLPELSGVVLPGTDARGGSGDGRVDTQPAAVTGPDTGGHGTAMANLIGAQGRGTGFVGVAPAVKLLPVVADGSASTALGIRFAVDHGAQVINISLAGPIECTAEEQESVAYAVEHDVVVVAAAGNLGDAGNPPTSPASCAGVFAIGGVDFEFNPFAKTQRQPYVAAAAPAEQVGSVLKDGRFHTSEGGTSSAAALTSAVVALVRSRFPDMSAREVVQRIIASARDVGPSGKDDQTGYGLIRPSHALVDEVAADSPNPVFDAYDQWKAATAEGSDPATAPAERAADESSGDLVVVLVLMLSAATLLGVLLLVTLLVVLPRSRRKRIAQVGSPHM